MREKETDYTVLGRFPGVGNGIPLQYACLENSMDRGAWWATQSTEPQRVGHNRALPHSYTVKLTGTKTCTEEHELISSFKEVCKSFERLYVLQKSTLLTQAISLKIKALQGLPTTTAFISLTGKSNEISLTQMELGFLE